MPQLKRIIVIGASAGGLGALTSLVSKLPSDMEAAVFVVLHLSKESMGEVLVKHICKHVDLRCKVATNNEPIKAATIYIAPPDFHLMVQKDKMVVVKGPHENRWRPSIDVLFRSAAVHYNSRTIGIVLTGMLNDGTAGMAEIKACEGVCIVQDPAEADFPDMPQSVINSVNVDHIVHIAEIPYILNDLLKTPAKDKVEIPQAIIVENHLTQKVEGKIEDLDQLGKRASLSCPECGGGLWHLDRQSVHRYRCHAGHAFTERILGLMQDEALEESLWITVRKLEERRHFWETMALREEQEGEKRASEKSFDKVEEMKKHIESVRQIIYRTE